MADGSTGEKVRLVRGDRTLREFAKLVGYSKSYLSQVERGAREASVEFLKAVAEAMGLPTLQLVPEGLPPKKTAGRLRGQIHVVRAAFGRRVVLPVPSGRLEHVFAEVRWCPEGAALVAELDAWRRPPLFWSAVRTIARGLTAPEQAAWLQLLLQKKGELQELHPHETAFPFPVVEAPGACPSVILLQVGQAVVTVRAQLSFLPRVDRVRRLDFLISAAFRGVVEHGNVEIDGPTHASSQRADRVRQAEIGLPFLRFRADEVYRSDFAPRVLAWICGRLKQACEERGKTVSFEAAPGKKARSSEGGGGQSRPRGRIH